MDDREYHRKFEYFQSKIISNPKTVFEEYSAAPILTAIENLKARYCFNKDKWFIALLKNSDKSRDNKSHYII